MSSVGARALLAVALLGTSGCADLLKSLHAEERRDPELALLFGTLRIEQTVLSFDELALERVSPPPRAEILVSSAGHFRLLRPRLIDQGAFLVPNVPPGVYRLRWVREGLSTWYSSGSDDIMRIAVTEPGVYDVGAWVLSGFDRLALEPRPDQSSRAQMLLAATVGTQWEPAAQELAARLAGPAR